MSVGKYSPTVSNAYQKNQNWWLENGGNQAKENHESWYDFDGYDSYGYDKNEIDRAGNTESDYLCDYDMDYDCYTLYENTYSEWTVNSKGVPIHFSQLEYDKNFTEEKKCKLK